MVTSLLSLRTAVFKLYPSLRGPLLNSLFMRHESQRTSLRDFWFFTKSYKGDDAARQSTGQRNLHTSTMRLATAVTIVSSFIACYVFAQDTSLKEVKSAFDSAEVSLFSLF